MLSFFLKQYIRSVIYGILDKLCDFHRTSWRLGIGKAQLSKTTWFSFDDWNTERLSDFLETIVSTDPQYRLVIKDVRFGNTSLTVYYDYDFLQLSPEDL